MSDLIYAIGDIHGHRSLLAETHAMIGQDAAGREHKVVHIGDYVDRGPDSAGVIEDLCAGLDAGAPWICLLGNHDRMFRVFLEDPNARDPILRPDYTWFHPALGALTTMQSYGVAEDTPVAMQSALLAKIPDRHCQFLSALEATYDTPSHFFCHAGIKPRVPLTEQIEDDLIWIRTPFHVEAAPHPKIIVHGHTPVDRATDYGNRINIDSGAAFGGALSTVVIDHGTVWHLTPTGRQRLHQAPPGQA